MLRASYTYRPKGSRRGRGAGTHMTEREMPRRLEELLDVVDRFSEMSSDLDGRFPPGSSGAHAWMSINDQGFVMHAYFEGHTITFELYGPTSVGREKDYADPYDGRGLSGELDADTLKNTVKLLDEGRSPRDYVQANAKKCAIVAD